SQVGSSFFRDDPTCDPGARSSLVRQCARLAAVGCARVTGAGYHRGKCGDLPSLSLAPEPGGPCCRGGRPGPDAPLPGVNCFRARRILQPKAAPTSGAVETTRYAPIAGDHQAQPPG